MGKATASPLLLGAILLAAVGALWLTTITVLPQPLPELPTHGREASATGGGVAAGETRSSPTPETLPPQPKSTEASEPEPASSITRTELTTASQTLHAVLVDREGNPRAGLAVALDSTRLNAAPLRSTSAADGTLSFPHLPPGSYFPDVAGHVVLEPAVIVIEDKRAPAVVRIVGVPIPRLAGHILDHHEHVVPRAWVIVEDLSGAELHKTRAKHDGTFRVEGDVRTIKHPGVRLWVHGGKWVAARKHETQWGDVDIALRVAPAPTGVLRVVAAHSGQPVRNLRVLAELAPEVRATTPWIPDGWIATTPDQDPEITGLGMVPQRLNIFPADARFACCSVDVAGGPVCHDVRVELAATATLTVHTEPPVVRAVVEVLRVPAGGAKWSASPTQERSSSYIPARDVVLMIGTSHTDARGQASVQGGIPGENVVVRVRAPGLVGQTNATLAPHGAIVVPITATARLDVTLAQAPSPPPRLIVERTTADGGPDPLGLGFDLQFDAAADAKIIGALMPLRSPDDARKIKLWMRATQMRDPAALGELLADPALGDDARRRLENWRQGDVQARLADLPPGRYRIAPYKSDERSPDTLAAFDLVAGEHRNLTLHLTQRPKLELKVTVPADNRDWALVDEDTGALCQVADARAGRARAIVFAHDGRRWLSRDVLPIPAHGVVTWTPSLAPMRITLRVRAPNGTPVAHAGVSRVRADDPDGWHGQPLGLTDAAGEVDLSGDVRPFKLRVDGVAPMLGPYTPDARREVQVIDVEVPAR